MSNDRFVTIFEMAPRDGLQNEKSFVSTQNKVQLVDLLSECGFKKIEVASFVSPKWVPQMADAADVMMSINREPQTSYSVLTPNLKGFEGATRVTPDEVAIFASASESFSLKNINCSIAQSIERFLPVIEAARAANIPVRGYVSCVTDCPYEGSVDPAQTAKVAAMLFEMGCYEVSLGDTIGHATPDSTAAMLDQVLKGVSADNLAGHFHDTRFRAIENIDVSLKKGIKVFDTSAGGLGGCPYAPGAKGNVDTRTVVAHLEKNGYETGIDKAKLNAAADFALSLVSN